MKGYISHSAVGFVILSLLCLLWFFIVPAKPGMPLEDGVRGVKPGRKLVPMVLLVWLFLIFFVLPATGWLFWRGMEEGYPARFFWVCTVPLIVGFALLSYMYALVRPCLWVSTESLRYRPMLGRTRELAWRDLEKIRWSPLTWNLSLTGADGTTVKPNASHDGFIEFLSEHLDRIDAIAPEAIPARMRRKAEVFRAAQAPPAY